MEDIRYFKDICEDLFWDAKPESLVIKQLLYQKQVDWGTIIVYSGVLLLDNKEIDCIIREISSLEDFIIEDAQNEIDAILITRKLNYFEECLGIYFENTQTENGILHYYNLVKKAYSMSISDCIVYEDSLKIKLLFQIVEGLYELSENNYYHGAICPENIFIDEKGLVRIGNLFHSGNVEYFPIDLEKLKRKIGLVNLDFVSPEFKLLNNFIQNNIAFKPFDCLKSDVFSFGLTSTYILTGKVYDFNKIDINSNLFPNVLINKSPTELDINEDENSYNIEASLSLSKLQTKILDAIIGITNFNPLLNKTLCSALQVYYDNRSSFGQLIQNFNKFQGFKKESLIQDYSSKLLKSKEVVKIIRSAGNFINKIRILEDVEKISLISKNNLRIFDEFYQESFRNFFDSNVGESTNGVDGVVIFFRSLFIHIQSTEGLREFIDYFRKNTKNIDLIKNFSKIVEQDDIITDYIFTGLQIFNLKKDWNFFFSNEPESIQFNYTPFKNIDILVEEFKQILSSSIIKSSLKRFIDTEEDILSIFFGNIIYNTFIIKIQPSLCGLSSYNRRIFLSDFKELDSINYNLAARGAIYITLLHELAHTFRRLKCKTLRDVKNTQTPEYNDKRLTYEEEFLLDSIGTRGEVGYKLETELFGAKVVQINDEAAEFLIDHHKIEAADDSYKKLPKFRKRFRYLISKGKSKSIPISRGSQFFTGVKCSMRLMSFN